MTYLKTVGGPGVAGLHPQEIVVTAKNGEASTPLVLGDVVVFDFASGTGLPGVEGSGFYTVKISPANGTNSITRRGCVVGVCQEPIAVGATGKVMMAGITNARSSACAKGDHLTIPAAAATAVNLAASTSTVTKIVAQALAITGTGPLGANTSTFPTVWFEGIHGFGQS